MSDMVRISKPEGAQTVTFKHESDDDGIVIGPVWFTVDDEYVPAIPGELDFTGEPSAEWMAKSEAIRMAKHFELEFREA